MFHSLIGTVVNVDEERFPVDSQGIIIYRKTMILRSNISFIRTRLKNRLIMAPVSIFQLIGISA